MKNMFLIFLFCFSLLSGLSFAKADDGLPSRCLHYVCFNQTKDLAGTTLPLRGLAKYEFWTLNLYTAALYLPAEASTPPLVLSELPKALILEYHRPIRASQIVDAANQKLQRNLGDRYDHFKQRIDAISAVYRDVGRGDRYELSYIPGSGTSLFLNGEHQITIPGADFAEAYFGIWLSETPLNAKLRDELTGFKSES